MAGVAKDLTGQVFSNLTVIQRSPKRGNGKKPVTLWECRCVCGKIVTVKADSLKSGHTISCGCRKVKHMESYKHKTRLYNIWKCMRQRCNNPNNPSYPHYGGKGVQICNDWNEYAGFRTWALAAGYDDSKSIDRINVDGNYCPENCRWTDAKTQANNTTRNHFIQFRGKRQTMAEVADQLGVSYATVQHRVERGQALER